MASFKEIAEAMEQHAEVDTANIADVAPPVQENGLFAKAAEQEAAQIQIEPAEESKGLFAAAADVLGAVYDEARRPALQGAAELAGALFNGTAFVPYGEGQRSGPDVEEPQHGLPPEAQVEKEQEIEMER